MNELEIINYGRFNNHVFANVYQSDSIFLISLNSGKVVAEWDLSRLQSIQAEKIGDKWGYDWTNHVLNGIAYHPPTDTFLITGKMWDFIWQIKLDYEYFIPYID